MKGIYEFYRDFGRMGDVESVFVATADQVKELIGKDIYFGEILGKHSEVSLRIKEDDITLKTDNQEFIKLFEEITGEGWNTGHSPLEYSSAGDYEYDDDEGDE